MSFDYYCYINNNNNNYYSFNENASSIELTGCSYDKNVLERKQLENTLF